MSTMADDRLELLLLHALPLDGSMWRAQMHLLPGATYAPTLYGFGDSIEAWAAGALKLMRGNRLIVVGCSVGGSCALEIAAMAPERIAALVLIGTKAHHRPEPALHASVLQLLRDEGLQAAWESCWAPLFSKSASKEVINEAMSIALRQSRENTARGVTVFHTRPSREQVLSSLPNPVTIITGEDDIAPGLETNAKQATQTQFGRLHIVPNCGHYVPLEQPEFFNAVLQELMGELREST